MYVNSMLTVGTEIFSKQKADEVNKTVSFPFFKDPVATTWSRVQQPLNHRCVTEQVALFRYPVALWKQNMLGIIIQKYI
jgi:hypothetical protein